MSGSTEIIQDPVNEKDDVVYISSGEESDIIEVEATTNDQLSRPAMRSEANDEEKGIGYSVFVQEEWNKVAKEVGSRDPKVVKMELSSRWKLMPKEGCGRFLENISKTHKVKQKPKQTKRKRGKRVQDHLMPKPPSSPFIMFVTRERPKVMEELGISRREADGELSKRWKNLGEDEKAALQNIFTKKKEEHRLAKAEYDRGKSEEVGIDTTGKVSKMKVKTAQRKTVENTKSGPYFAFVEETWWKLAAAQPKMEGHMLMQLIWQNWLEKDGTMRKETGDKEMFEPGEDQSAGAKEGCVGGYLFELARMTEVEIQEGNVQKESLKLLQQISFKEGEYIKSKEVSADVAVAKEIEEGSLMDDQVGNSDLPAKKVVATKADDAKNPEIGSFVSQAKEANQKNILQLPVPPRSALAFFKAHLIDESTGNLKECELIAKWEEMEVCGRLKFENMADADKTRYMGEVQERFAG